MLKEAVVTAKKKRSLSARAIVRRAIRAIPSNYPLHPFSTVGYYRDYQLKEGDYLNLNEAILEVFDQGFDERDQTSTKVRIYEYRPNMDFDRDVEADNQYNYENWSKVIDRAYLYNFGGNEFAILRVHDALRNYNVDSYDFVNKLESDLLNNHSFSKAEDSYYEDELLYQIEFEKSMKGFLANGTLYISKKDFAIYQMEYALYDNLKRKKSGETNRKNSEKKLIFEVLTEYKKKNNKMFLNYISFHNSFQLIRPPLFVVKEVLVDLPKRCFIVEFNNFVSGAFAVEKKNYDFKFKGQRIKFKRIEPHDEYVELYADGTEKELYEMMHEIDIAVRKKLDVKDLLDLRFEKIRDVEGNVINEPGYEEYQQFREYFVQETKTRVNLPLDTLYMKRDRPIFKDQPTAKPDNFKEYWMNTPIQKPEE